jgi:hypothetical protein
MTNATAHRQSPDIINHKLWFMLKCDFKFFFLKNVIYLVFLHVTKTYSRLRIIMEITVKFNDLTTLLMNILVMQDMKLCRMTQWY